MSLASSIQELSAFASKATINAPLMLLIIAILWGIHFINMATGGLIKLLGIIPRHPLGLPGIVFSPFIHGDKNHLFFNTVPLMLLILFILGLGKSVFYLVTSLIILISGFGTWLFGRPGIHIGASSVIAGYFTFLLGLAYEKPTTTTIILALIAFYYFGGILFSFIPTNEKTSFEGHTSGLVAGLLTLYLMKDQTVLRWVGVY